MNDHEQLRLPAELVGDLCGCVPHRSTLEARPTISRLTAAGLGPTAIARHLNASGVATPTGRGRWYPETVIRHREPARWAAYMRRYRAERAAG